MQAFPSKYDNGVILAANDMVKEYGPGFLLTGFIATVLGYGVEGAMKVSSIYKDVQWHVHCYYVFCYVISSAYMSK